MSDWCGNLIGPNCCSSRLGCSGWRFGTGYLNGLGGTGVPKTQALVWNSYLITGRRRVLTHKHEWCWDAWHIIPSTVESWQRCKRLEDLQRCITQGHVGGSDPFLAGCVSLLSGAHWPIIHNTNSQAPAIHLGLQSVWSLTPTCCCSWSLDKLGSLQLPTASTAGRNPRLSCTGPLWLRLPFNSSLSSLAREEPGIQSCSYQTPFTVICIQFAVWSWGTMLLWREKSDVGEWKTLSHTGSRSCFCIFTGLFTFAVSRKWEQRNLWVMRIAESHLMHQTIDVNLVQACGDYILTCVSKQLVSGVFVLMLISE